VTVDLEILARLAIAAALTAVIGIDRELRSKPAGLRTNIVVGTATAAFTYIGAEVIAGGAADPTRVASQVVSGIGFLGGGAIFAAGGKPSGLTTAAALWGSAAIGMAAGIGRPEIAVALVLVMFVVLWPLDVFVERALRSHGRHELRAQVVLEDLAAFDAFRQSLGGEHLKVISLDLDQGPPHPTVTLQLAGRAGPLATALDELRTAEGVLLVASDSLTRLDT
jgi:putative Mg2+ transporter-C (MgtC) family protein